MKVMNGGNGDGICDNGSSCNSLRAVVPVVVLAVAMRRWCWWLWWRCMLVVLMALVVRRGRGWSIHRPGFGQVGKMLSLTANTTVQSKDRV